MAGIAPVMAASAAVTAIGMLSLHAARRQPTGAFRTAVGWLGAGYLALGLAIAGLGWSWQVAIPIWLSLAGLGGFAVALTAAIVDADKPARRRAGLTSGPSDEPTARATTRTIAALRLPAAVLTGGAVSAIVALASAAWLPGPDADRAMLGVVLWPALWTWAICRLYAAPRPGRAFSGIAGLGAVAALAVTVRLFG